MRKLDFSFEGGLWVYPGETPWHFLTLPEDISEELKSLRGKPRGFGSMRVAVKVGATQWQTSIFPDKLSNSFILPVKAEVRVKEDLGEGSLTRVEISVEL